MGNTFKPTEAMKNDFNITEPMLKYADKQCRCPYCFGLFTPLTAAFRIAPESVCTNQRFETLTPDEQNVNQPYQEMYDAIYESFWNRFPGSAPSDDLSRSIARRPAMHMLLENHLRGKFFADEEGFPIGMTDDKGHMSDIRICPQCHNQLPLNFGKHPVKYIALVGITSSGKTVYLSQMLKELYLNLSDIGFFQLDGMDETEKFCKANLVKKGERLPTGNAADKLTLPIAITVQNKETREIHTLVFYDIAGENCVNAEGMRKYGPFIVNADGIIMIADPSQFSGLLDAEDDLNEDAANPGKVIEAMYRAFVAAKTIRGQCNVPVAVAISKSDLLRPYFENQNSNSILFHNINYKEYGYKGFPYDDYQDVTSEVKTLLRKDRFGRNFVGVVKNSFAKSDFFAFSALNVKPVAREEDGSTYYTIEEDPETLRVEEPFNWILYQLGMLEKITRDEWDGDGKKNKKIWGIFKSNR